MCVYINVYKKIPEFSLVKMKLELTGSLRDTIGGPSRRNPTRERRDPSSQEKTVFGPT